jgi:hypothetical protein
VKQWLPLLLLTAWMAAFAQESPRESADANTPDVDENRTCIPAAEAEQASSGESGPSEEGELDDGAPTLPICGESEVADTSEEPAAEEVEESATDGDSEEDFAEIDDGGQEFEPGEEISEDYPVPLPSDI